MKLKKTKKANLENYRILFLQIGIVLTLSLLLAAFEWKTDVNIEELTLENVDWTEAEVIIPITEAREEVKAVKPPSFELVIVENERNIIDEDLSDLISEVDENTAITIYELNEEPEEINEEPLLFAQFMPKFKGGDENRFREYISNNVKFPAIAAESAIAGVVYASFVVNKKGKVTNVEVVRGVHPVIDKAVVKVIKNSPDWEPGINNGKYVNIKYTIPVKFKLL
ncbi:MAG: energy transducer TonB [Bacteroidales bacterium]|nr:energy transducer TonB [Bacteroidales bacterium]